MTYPDWFSQTAKPNFEKFLPEFKDRKSLKFLQLGAYTGDASVWICDNIFSDTFHHMLFDIDTWRGSDEAAHKDMDFNDVYDYYISRVRPKHYVRPYRLHTLDFLTSEKCKFGPYDFIYIDADHTTVGVLMDAMLSWPQLKSGGILAFDDYKWGFNLPVSQRPQLGIDLFLERHEGKYDLLEMDQQVWIKKK